MPTFNISDFDPINQRNLKALDNGGTIEYWQKGKVFAIGAGHKPDLMTALKGPGGTKGSIKITKGSGTNPGMLEVTHCPGRREFEDGIKRISKKKVVFK
jgi:hypothetical protein